MLWKAAALGLLGPPAAGAALLVGVYVGIGSATGRSPRAERWCARLGWDALCEAASVAGLALSVGVTGLLGAGALVGVPAGLAWWIWHDAAHAAVAGVAGVATLTLGLAWINRPRRGAA